MSARVLVVDDLVVNTKLICARLRGEAFEVIPALGAAEALDICRQGLCDIVLTGAAMPGMDGFDLCRELKADPRTSSSPVVMMTDRDEPGDRIRGLDCGADEFLVRPFDEAALFARLRGLARLKAMIDEARARALTGRLLGLPDPADPEGTSARGAGSVLVIEDRAESAERLAAIIGAEFQTIVESDPLEALFRAATGRFDVVMVSLDVNGYDALRLCGQLRSLERTRQTGLLVLAEPDDALRASRALEIGANDVLVRPFDRREVMARVRQQVQRKRLADRLRDLPDGCDDPTVVDRLTNLHGPSYFPNHCRLLMEEARRMGRPLAIFLLEIDRLASLTGVFGPRAGEAALKAVADRLRRHVRPVDLVARLDDERFVAIMPDTPADTARSIAERVRFVIEGERVPIDQGARSVPVTASIGVAALEDEADTADTLLLRAEDAIPPARREGLGTAGARDRAA